MRGRPVSATPTKSDRRIEIFEQLLDLFPPGRLADLGAGHGIFSRLAAGRGWRVTAIDARTERWPDDPRVTWVHKDVREADISGQDLILCLGLFYHLTLPDQLDLLARCAGTPLVVDTHLGTGNSRHPLSEEVTLDGYAGRYYDENLSSPLASWVNEKSFWPTREAFDRMLAENRYGVVLVAEPWYLPDRTFFVCLPEIAALGNSGWGAG